MNAIKTTIQLTGIASLVLFVGATRPAAAPVMTKVAAKAAAIAKVVESNNAELLHEATTASAMMPAGKHYRTIRMEVTAYCPCTKCCGENAEGITASGRDVSYNQGRFVAADTDVLPFGTKLVIPGYHGKPVEVIDRGGAIKGNKLDLFYPTHEEALQWGRQIIEVTIVD